MKLCLPITKNDDLEEVINKDFETTNHYMIYDTGSARSTVFLEKDLILKFAVDNTLEALIKAGVIAIIAPVIRSAAFVILKNRTDIRIFTSISDNVQENIDLYTADKLNELTRDMLQFSMGCSGSCSSCESLTCE